MGVSRVDFDGETLVDLTGDTVMPQSLLSGYTAHNKAGELIEGLAVVPKKVSELENDSKFITETGDSSKTTVTFEQAAERANVHPGDDLETAFAKLSKYCADLKQVAFSGKYMDLEGRITLTNNLFATKTGTALDATQGANLKTQLTAVTTMISCEEPETKADVLNLINDNVDLFKKTSVVPVRIYTTGKKLGEEVANGNYFGILEYKGGNVTGFLTNHWNPANRLCIAATLYLNPQQITIKFENFEYFYEKINQLNSDLSSRLKLYDRTVLQITPSQCTFSDIITRLKAKGENTGIEFGGWTDSYVNLNFPQGFGNRFYISIRYYADGYASAELTDLGSVKKYLSTISSDGKIDFDNWVQL